MMVDIHFESRFISRRSPCLSLPCLLEKKKINFKVHSLSAGHGSVRRSSHIMMFDQGNSRFCNGVNELTRMTLIQSPFCFSGETRVCYTGVWVA